jgi:rhodanese-related sulfurtransferase
MAANFSHLARVAITCTFLALAGFSDGAESVVVQADGKIVVGGFAEDSFDGYGVARINP